MSQKNLSIYNSLIKPTACYAIQSGVTTAEINRILGVDIANSEFPDFRIKPDSYIKLIKRLSEKTNDPYLGLHIGRLVKPDHLGILGYLLMNCTNIAEVFDKLKKYHLIIGNIVELQIYQLGTNHVECRLSLDNEHLRPVRREILEGYITGFLKLYYQLTNSYDHIKAIHLDWPAPSDRSQYEGILQTHVTFDQPSVAVIFDSTCRQQTVISSNTKLKAFFEAYANKCYRELHSDRFYSDAVIRTLSNRIADMPGLDDVAYSLGLSGKSLQKKLKIENSTFNRLQDKVRFEFVRNYLTDNSYSAERICLLLGYSEPSAFYRAFKRWTGMSLTRYRSQTLNYSRT